MIFTNLFLDDEDLYEKIASLPQERTYLSGPLTIFDTDDLILPTHIERYDTITLSYFAFNFPVRLHGNGEQGTGSREKEDSKFFLLLIKDAT